MARSQAWPVAHRHATWLSERPEQLYERVTGTLVFLDVSGFTRLSERLARRGRDGAEELTELISEVLGSQIAAVSAYGGDVLSFGGDALLVLFEGTDHVARAVTAAADARDAMRAFRSLPTSVGAVTLRISIGVETGPIDLYLVGSPERRLVPAGATVTAALALEAAASAGTVLVGPAASAALWGRTEATRLDPRRLAVVRRRPVGDRSVDDQEPPTARIATLLADAEPEHRRVVAAFVRFTGTDTIDPDLLAADLDQALTLASDIAGRHAVAIWAVDVDSDAVKLILVAGAPVTRGDNGDRMIAAALELVATSPLPARAGLHAGRVFMSEVGDRNRSTWTVMGDAVNAAARLAGHAQEGEVVSGVDVVRSGRLAWITSPPSDLTVKGRHEPLPAVVIAGIDESRRAARGQDRLLVGRDREQALALDAIRRSTVAADGAPAIVEIVGQAGIGKTELLSCVMDALLAESPTLIDLDVRATTYASASPYLALRGPLRWLLGVSVDDETAVAAALVELVTAVDPGLVPWLPLVAEVWRIHLPGTADVAALSPEFVAARRIEHGLAALRHLLPRGSVITVEDAHWLDPDSEAFLTAAAALPDRPWTVIRTVRSRAPSPGEDPAVCRIPLTPLGREDAMTAVRAALPDLARPHVEQLVERSQGVPLFLVELTNAIATGADPDRLPDTLEELLSSEIDRLAPAPRRLLRRLAVLGARAPAPLALALLDEPGRPADLSARAIIDEFVSISGGYANFRHALVREAAYDGLATKTRRVLHSVVADLVATDAVPIEVGERTDLLASHLHLAGRHAQSWEWSRRAGKDARARGAPAAAVVHLSRADVDTRHHQVEPADHRTVLLDLAESAALSGRRDIQRSALVRAARLPQSTVQLADLARVRGRTWGTAETVAVARRWFSRGLRLLGDVDDADAARIRAKLVAADADVLTHAWRSAEALEVVDRAMALARLAGDIETMADVAATRAFALLQIAGDEESSTRTRTAALEALALARDAGRDDLLGAALSLASEALIEVDPERASALALEARDAHVRAGNRGRAAAADALLASICLMDGRLDLAEDLLTESVRTWKEFRYYTGIANLLTLVAVVEIRRGSLSAARARLAEARDFFATHPHPAGDLHLWLREVETEALLGDPQLALAHATADDLVSGVFQSPEAAPHLALWTSIAHLRSGNLDTAREILAQVTRTLLEQGDATYGSVAKYALGAVLADRREGRRLMTEAEDAFADWGYVTVRTYLDPNDAGWLDSDPTGANVTSSR